MSILNEIAGTVEGWEAETLVILYKIEKFVCNLDRAI